MELARDANDEQARLWNGPAGRAWIETQELLDRMFEPIQDLLAGSMPAGAGGRLLDVGCGTGATTLAFARQLGPQARCVGVDISQPMIALARARAARAASPATFVCADAQVHALEPAHFDSIVSRFGVMFFEDPVRAFSNLRGAAKKGASLRFVAWRSAAENPFMTVAERAAAPLLPELPPRKRGAPGQFAFADRHRMVAILQASGWGAIDIQPLDVTCVLSEDELVRYASWMGPVGQWLQKVHGPIRDQVIETVRAAFDPYVEDSAIRFTAACWMVEGRAGSGAC